MMGQADYFLDGSYNFFCQECGKKHKAVDGLRRWDGFWVGPECFEIRNPQDFGRGIPDGQSVPWSTGNVPPKFIDDGGGVTPQVSGPSPLLDAYLLGSTMLG